LRELLQGGHGQRQWDELAADDEAGGTAESKRGGFFRIARQDCRDLRGVSGSIARQLGQIHAGRLEDAVYLGVFVEVVRCADQGFVRDEEFALPVRGQGRARGVFRDVAKDGPLLVDDPYLMIGAQEFLQLGSGFLAERAVVVEELNDCDVGFFGSRRGYGRVLCECGHHFRCRFARLGGTRGDWGQDKGEGENRGEGEPGSARFLLHLRRPHA
jgi:hypothetical protein